MIRRFVRRKTPFSSTELNASDRTLITENPEKILLSVQSQPDRARIAFKIHLMAGKILAVVITVQLSCSRGFHRDLSRNENIRFLVAFVPALLIFREQVKGSEEINGFDGTAIDEAVISLCMRSGTEAVTVI